MNAVSSIRTTAQAVPEVIQPILHAATLAFSADPIARWMFPNPHHYLTHFPQFVNAFGNPAFIHNSAYYANNHAGTALWFPPDVQPDEETILTFIQRTVAPSRQETLMALLEQMGDYHPHEPHWYLAVLGVEPLQQKKGYGSALIRPILEVCDRDRTLAYLESSNPANVPFYEKHGFEVVGVIQVADSPMMFPMVRYPR